MSLRIEGIGRIGFVAVSLFLACSESDGSAGGGTAGAASSSAGTSAGMNATGGGGSSATAGGSGSGMAGSSSGAGAAGAAMGGSAGVSMGGSAGVSAGGGGGSGGTKSKTTFFVTSDTSKTGNLGGLEGADMRCQKLAMAAGFGDHTWRAYLSTSTVNAKDRIGTGPWINSKGATLAADLTALHALKGNADLFLDEKGAKINGQWQGSPQPNQHDVFTGSSAAGEAVAGKTCSDWTSESAQQVAVVGHSDGMGPGMSTDGQYSSWNSSHDNGSCADTAPKGGAGKLYCFASD